MYIAIIILPYFNPMQMNWYVSIKTVPMVIVASVMKCAQSHRIRCSQTYPLRAMPAIPCLVWTLTLMMLYLCDVV